jgi:uncharacterized protein
VWPVLYYFLLVMLGVIIGIFGTLIGAGGGFILMPILLLLYPKDTPDTLTSISLSVTFINALSGTIAYIRMNRINFKYGLIFSAASVPGAVFGASITHFISRSLFTFIFAILMIAASIFIFFNSKHEMHPVRNHKINLSSNKLVTGIMFSMVVGMVSSFLGIGGGIIHVPVLNSILAFPVHTATATSHFILSITSFSGLLVHIISGKFISGIRRAISISLGALIGAQLGAILSSRIKAKLITQALSVALCFVGIRLAVMFFIN